MGKFLGILIASCMVIAYISDYTSYKEVKYVIEKKYGVEFIDLTNKNIYKEVGEKDVQRTNIKVR